MEWFEKGTVIFIGICTLINVCLAILTTFETNDFLYRKKTELLNWFNKKKTR